MIETTVPGVDASRYIYDTGLRFGEAFGRRLLDIALVDEGYFRPRHNYDNALKDPWATYDRLGVDKTRELLRRYRQVRRAFPGHKPIEFKQFYLPDDAVTELLALTPSFLKELSPGEPVPIFQISEGGNLLPVHRGHRRRSSMFMLLQGDNDETRWYREREPFEVIPTTRIPDLDKIEHVVSARIEPGRWYVFNHLEWHSVHKNGGRKRISVGLDFDAVHAETLVAAIRANEARELSADGPGATAGSIVQLSAPALKAMIDRGDRFQFIDVRTPMEREIAAIEGSRLLDQSVHDELMKMDRGTPLVFQCHHGIRSQAAAEYFLSAGFRTLYNLRGGIEDWSRLVDPSLPRY
jgi:rhodanese-related sulfurtransferase